MDRRAYNLTKDLKARRIFLSGVDRPAHARHIICRTIMFDDAVVLGTSHILTFRPMATCYIESFSPFSFSLGFVLLTLRYVVASPT